MLFRLAADQLTALAELDHLLARHDVPYWPFGGWPSISTLVESRVSMPTSTLPFGCVTACAWRFLAAAEWLHRPNADEDGYTFYQRGVVRLEVAFLARDDEGDVYTPLLAGRGEWPSNSFGDTVRALNGVRARLVNREALIADKSVVRPNHDTAAKDRADVATLSEPDVTFSDPPPDDR